MANETNYSTAPNKDVPGDGSSSQTPGLSGKAGDASPATTERLKEAGAAIKEKAVELGSEQAEQATRQAADGIDSVSASIESAADALREQNMAGLADYAEDLSVSIADISHSIKHRSVEQLLGDISAAAKRNPGLFIAGSLAAGFVLARFMNASAQRSHRDTVAAGPARQRDSGSTNTDTPDDTDAAFDHSASPRQSMASNSTHVAAQGDDAGSTFESRVLRPEAAAPASAAFRPDKLIEPGGVHEPKSSGPISVTDQERLIQAGSTATKPTNPTQEKK